MNCIPTDEEYLKFVRSLQLTTSPRFALKQECFFSPALMHAIYGLSTEAGELIDLVKKNIGYQRQVNISKIKDELGDILYYLTLACDECHSNIPEIMAINFAKLKTRYPKGYSDSKANNRNLSKEIKAIDDSSEPKLDL